MQSNFSSDPYRSPMNGRDNSLSRLNSRYLAILAVLAIMVMIQAGSGCSTMGERLVAQTIDPGHYQATPQAAALHRSLTIVDLHADTLLWTRDLLQRGQRGHVDLPRLQEANVALQTFGVVTAVPFPLSMEDNNDGMDMLRLLSSWQNWPQATRKSRFERAIYQAGKLDDRIDASGGQLRSVRTVADLDLLLDARASGERSIGALLSLEGVHALEDNVDNFEHLFDAGFRIFGLVHLFDNTMAGSVHGTGRHGLSEAGRELVRRIQARGAIVDLAHSSVATVDDVLAMTAAPVIVSHGGVRGTCDSVRNLSDEQVRGIARSGGVIGIGLYKYATCGNSVDFTVRAMRYVADLVGVDYVALGSDFDGAKAMIDVTGLVLLTQALRDDGFSEAEIAAIMGGNSLRVLRAVLPAR